GFRRANGKAGTRNFIAIISTVNCSATSSRMIAQQIEPELLARYPHVDGVIALTHKGGCAFEYQGPDHEQLNRTLAGFARHPNICGHLVIGLGCETAQADYLIESQGLVTLQTDPKTASVTSSSRPAINIQQSGGIRKTVEKALSALPELLQEADRARRVPIPLSELILGTECGGSDGYSGVTANPAIGIASDLLVQHGGTSILSEVPEIYGGEHLLTRRAISREVGEKLIERIRWWEHYAELFHCQIDNNPSVGNKKGGLTTIFEKSLGAIAKGGSTALRAVYNYAEPVLEKGFVIMDTPGYDPASVTGMIAGGAQVNVFSTGRGSCFGSKPAPTIKVCSNTATYQALIEDMDIDAGKVLSGVSLQQLGEEIFEDVIAVASGKMTKSEQLGMGDEEFCPWSPGPIF
ncbi:MAG: UxaA family hydrolase, partial [Planctomycetaceae bacterium]|nr:UxaA family hydrolase [Planctomycetaceae bacterium]